MPSRHIPFGIQLGLILGGGRSRAGLLVAGLLGVVAWLVGYNADLDAMRLATGEVLTASGEVISAQATNFEINEEPVFTNIYRYTDYQGQAHNGVAYATGGRFDRGSSVEVRYLMSAPAVSALPDMRSAPLPGWTIVFALLPLIGVYLLVTGVRNGLRQVDVLRHGELAPAKLIDKQPTNVSINDERVYRLTFEFSDTRGRSHRTITKTHRTDALEDNAEELVIYRSGAEQRATLVDALPGDLRIDGTAVRSTSRGIGAVVLALFMLGPHLAFALL